jgi:hypothetical protein
MVWINYFSINLLSLKTINTDFRARKINNQENSLFGKQESFLILCCPEVLFML